jgi:hypothetical protein
VCGSDRIALMSIRLTVISKAAAGDRGTIYYNNGPMLLLQGDDADAPDLCCGSCGATLVQGMSHLRFVDPDKAPPDAKPIYLTPPPGKGPAVISKTLSFKGADKPLAGVVLCCPGCRSLNDTLMGESRQQ